MLFINNSFMKFYYTNKLFKGCKKTHIYFFNKIIVKDYQKKCQKKKFPGDNSQN